MKNYVRKRTKTMINNPKLIEKLIAKIKNIKKEDIDKAIKEIEKEKEEK